MTFVTFTCRTCICGLVFGVIRGCFVWPATATPDAWWEGAVPAPAPERPVRLPGVAGPFAFGTHGGLADVTRVFWHVFGMVLVILRAAPAAALAWRVGTTAAPAMTKVSDTHLLAALRARQPKGLLWWGNFQPRFLARLGRENAYVLLQSSYPSKPSIQPRTNTVAPNPARTFCPQKPIVPGVPHLLVDHLQHLGLCFYQFLRLGIIHVFQRRCTDPKVLVWLRAPNQRVETIPVGQSPKFHTGSVVV